MEDKNSFDDIILEKNNKGEKIKKILFRVIALVILFLIVIIVMKLINGGSNNESTANNETQGILPVEPSALVNENTTFKEVPITQSANSELDEFERLRRQLQEEQSPANEENTTTIAPAQELASPAPSLDVKEEQVPKQEPVRSLAKPKDEVKVQEQVKQNNQTKDLFKNTSSTSAEENLAPGTYIQIFSVSNFDPKSKELKPITDNGYSFKAYKSQVNGKELIRILVGPFDNASITSHMQKIRENIKKDAFVYRIQ